MAQDDNNNLGGFMLFAQRELVQHSHNVGAQCRHKIEDIDKYGKSNGECLHLAKHQTEFARGHSTWTFQVGDEMTKVFLDLETKEVFYEEQQMTVACSLGATIFNIHGKLARLEDKGDGRWVLEVKDCQVKVFQPRNGPNKS
ncbi:hypothetical protein CAEBREN_25660 [Caenorhabditis brenneri]|uniref:Uncharacterized protein n=1 Tax=Caenorhabditis brenneri TaxID=135651 RepID=G0NJX5_CAEBE|nr:hypothetical protein CAEBREN_25660 [Caenorhabditis brenneri]